MKVIDADTHVIETEQTWEYLEGDEKRFRPVGVEVREPDGSQKEHWLIDGKYLPRRSNIGRAYTTQGQREMSDIAGRIADMDKLGVDIQVLYPSLFLTPATKRADQEIALCHSYNRWLADISVEGHGRFAWIATLPFMSMDEALKELRWAKQNGACGIFMRGFELDKRPCDPYFFPLYEEAVKQDIALSYHVALGSSWMVEAFGSESFSTFKFPVFNAFWCLIANRIPQKFPGLRMGFVEASSQWVPYVVHHLALSASLRNTGVKIDNGLLQSSNFFVTCQTDDDLDYVVRYSGEDNLIIGTDYGHADTSTELHALSTLREQGKVEPTVTDKILTANPARFYGL